MKKLLVLVLIFVSLLSFSQEIPKQKGFVSDYENILTPEQEKEINGVLSNYERKTSVEIVILTVPDFGDYDIFTFSQETFDKWKIGKKGVDNGLLIVLSKNEGKIRSHTGYGLEGYLPDGWLNHTGDSIGIKYKGDYYNGLLKYISLIQARIGEEYDEDINSDIIKESENNKEDSIFKWMIENVPWYVWIFIGMGFIILLFVCPDCALILLAIVLSKNNDSGSSSSSGGGSSGGGGSTSNW